MTVHAVLADPPREGLVLPELPETAPVTAAEAAELYAAMVKDTVQAVDASGGELLVNYRTEDDLPEGHRTGTAPEAELRGLVGRVLDDPDAARYEAQVGSSYAARAGNTATHLLREEGAASVAVMPGTAPTLARTDLDSAAMKLRRSPVVIGAAPDGRVHYLGVSTPIDFEDAFAPPAAVTLAERAAAAGHGVDFLGLHPTVATGEDLASLVTWIASRRAAGRIVPTFTADLVDRWGLAVGTEDGRLRLRRGNGTPETDTS